MEKAARALVDPAPTYRGVSITPSGKYRASVSVGGKRHHLGMFRTALEAARAYDLKAIELGITDRLNNVDIASIAEISGINNLPTQQTESLVHVSGDISDADSDRSGGSTIPEITQEKDDAVDAAHLLLLLAGTTSPTVSKSCAAERIHSAGRPVDVGQSSETFFTWDEDNVLRRVHFELQRSGTPMKPEWTMIAKRLPGHDVDSIRKRWGLLFGQVTTAPISSTIDNDSFDRASTRKYTDAENEILLEACARLGNQWDKIAALLPGRKPAGVKAHYGRLRRKRQRKRQHIDSVFVDDTSQESDTGSDNSDSNARALKRSRAGGDNPEMENMHDTLKTSGNSHFHDHNSMAHSAMWTAPKSPALYQQNFPSPVLPYHIRAELAGSLPPPTPCVGP